MLDFFKEIYIDGGAEDRLFRYEDFTDNRFRGRYGDYLLGEIKDSLSFYYDEEEYELFLKFFEYLNGANKFSSEEYELAFIEFSKFLAAQTKPTPGFMKSSEEFLQFLYDQNVLCFVEVAGDEKFIRWCFRERNPTNISPKVKMGMSYEIHYGLANALNTGKPISKPAKAIDRDNVETTERSSGRIRMVDFGKGFGFIRQVGIPIDIHFYITDCTNKRALRKGGTVRYILKKESKRRAVCGKY